MQCSNCKEDSIATDRQGKPKTKFCPDCGAKVVQAEPPDATAQKLADLEKRLEDQGKEIESLKAGKKKEVLP